MPLQTYADRRGLLVTSTEESIDSLLKEQRMRSRSLTELQKRADEGRAAELLRDSPRLEKRSTAIRRMYFAFDRISNIEVIGIDFARQLRVGPRTDDKFRRRGRYDSVRRLLEQELYQRRTTETSRKIFGETGAGANCVRHSRSANEMWPLICSTWIREREYREQARAMRRVDRAQGTSQSRGVSYVVINGMAVAQQSSATAVSAWMQMAIG